MPRSDDRPNTSGLRERNKQDKLRRITEAASELFTRQGFEATTTKEIARRAEIGTGTLFLYARDKRELLFLIFRGQVEGVIERAFASLPEAEPLLQQLAHVFGGFFDHYAQNLELSRLFVKELMFLPGERQVEYSSVTLGFFLRMAELLDRAKVRGEVRADVPSPAAAANFFALYIYHLLLWLQGVTTREMAQQQLAMAMELQLSGLR